MQELKPRLTRQEKNELKYERSKERNRIQRKKIAKRVKKKIYQLKPELKDKYYEIKRNAEQKLKQAQECGIPVYLDLEYEVLMSDREIRSMSLQVSHLIGINKELQSPVQLNLTNVTGLQKTELIKQGLEKWPIKYFEEDLAELIEKNTSKKEFIYLSPDAEEELDNVDPDKYIYVVGGFVDRQVQKYMSLNKASTLQLCSRRLPIDQYQKKHKRPLNIDQVVAILSLYHSTHDWQRAYEEAYLFNVSIAEKLLKQQEAENI